MVEDERSTAESGQDAGVTGQMADLPTKCTGMLERVVSDTFVLNGEEALTKEECTVVTAMVKENILPNLVNGLARLRHARNNAEVRVTGLIVSLAWDIVIHQGAAETIRPHHGAVRTANAARRPLRYWWKLAWCLVGPCAIEHGQGVGLLPRMAQ